MANIGIKLSFYCTHGTKHLLSRGAPSVIVPVRTKKGLQYHPDSFIGFRVEPRELHERQYVSHPLIYKDADPAPRFMDCRVQAILKSLTGYDANKVFRHRALFDISAPEMVFLTDEQLEEAQSYSEKKAARLLTMPPVVKARDEEPSVISYDPALSGLMPGFKTVFTDISLGVEDQNRIIVVRDNTGTLRHANLDERRRMNQIYNPRGGRKLYVSELFTARFLPNALDREEYEFVLDRACQQFEPDDPAFQSSAAYVYEAVDERQRYDKLLSTRHYGPMLFFLVWHKKLQNYLAFHLQNGRLTEAGEAVKLYCIVHQKSNVAQAVTLDSDEAMHLIETYLAKECPDSAAPVHLALIQCKELLRNRQAATQNAASALGQAP